MVYWYENKIADHGFLINLKEREDRLQESISELSRINLKGVERFDAIKFSDDDELQFLGCSESHKKIFQYQVDSNIKKMLILEDDFRFDPHPRTISDKQSSELLSEIIYSIDFDLLHLGVALTEPSEKVNEFISKPKSSCQTTAYIIDIKLSEFILNNYDFREKDSIFNKEAIDTFFSILQTKTSWRGNNFVDKDIVEKNEFKIYFINPILFNQRKSYSDIQKRISDTSLTSKMRNIDNI